MKNRLASIIRNSFIFKNGNRIYKYLVLGHEEAIFVKEHSDSKNKYSEDGIIKMLEFLVDNIFAVLGGKVFQQIVGIPMGTICASLLADIFLYSHEAEYIQTLLSTDRKQLASRFNFTYKYIDYLLSINNPEFENYLGKMYPVALEIKDTTENNTSASYLDLLLSLGRDGQPYTSIYDKRDDFNFHRSDFILIRDLLTELDLLPTYERFHRTFATDEACWQGTLTPPDTWSRPIWDLHMFCLLRPILSGTIFFSALFTSNIPRYFLDFAYYRCQYSLTIGSREHVTKNIGVLQLG